MVALMKLVGWMVVTALMLAAMTELDDGTPMSSKTVVLGLPVVSVSQKGAQGWLAIGQVASGVLVIAQGGVGVVAIVQGGVGLVFGIGQGMLSLACIAQAGVGVFFFVGQVGVGAQAAGQGVFKRRDKEYFKEMSEEFTELLSFGAPVKP